MIFRAIYNSVIFLLFTGLTFSQETPPPKFYFSQIGEASYYGDEFHNRKTSNGEIYNKNEFTAAHPFLAFGTSLKVTNLKNNKAVFVRINDRGPYKKGRVIDLSYAAAAQLGIIKHGTAKVKIETLAEPEEDNLNEVILYDDFISKGEEYYILYKNPVDSAKISKIISNDGRLKISLFRQKKPIIKETSAVNTDTIRKVGSTDEGFKKVISFSVQVGAFINFDNADELRQLLQGKKYMGVEISSLRERNSSIYRVYVGNFKTRDEATHIKNKLLNDNIVGFIITKGN
jgi:rare lipoprotein A (peptidoglycan hydrolase)